MSILERIKEECGENLGCAVCKIYDLCVFNNYAVPCDWDSEKIAEIEKRLGDEHKEKEA